MTIQSTLDLPTWDLTHFYASTSDPKIAEDIATAQEKVSAFQSAYQGKLATLAPEGFVQSVQDYEAIEDLIGKLYSYSSLLYAGDNSDPEITRFSQNISEKMTDIGSHLIFYTLELTQLDDDVIAHFYTNPVAAQYRPWIEDVRVFRPHMLSDDLEKMLHEKRISGASAWNRLFDETMAGLRFDFQGQKVTVSDVLDKLSSTQQAERKEAATALGTVLGENIRLFSLITNTLAKDKATEDKWRHYERPISARNKGNFVEDEVVDALISSVKASYGDLSHRYYKMKAQWFGQDKLDYWDRNAPLPNEVDRHIPWAEAQEIVLKAYGAFDPEMATIGQRFFDENWIDVPPREGKNSGAFAHPTVPSMHPYLLLNYHGKVRDVMTLAHELGHGIHQVLAADQGALMADTPLTLAETASVFGEMLTFQSLLKQEQDAEKRRIMLAGKVEDMLNTVVRQVAFCDFERQLHDARREGELTPDHIGDIWMGVQQESLGDAVRFRDEYRHYWAYIPHFVHTPFYVYAYAFGDCLVNSLYDVYQQSETGFTQKYRDMLAAGGSKRHKELLAPFGLDASDPAFWQRGLKMISGFIDELEK